jgi:hypothetical protein
MTLRVRGSQPRIRDSICSRQPCISDWAPPRRDSIGSSPVRSRMSPDRAGALYSAADRAVTTQSCRQPLAPAGIRRRFDGSKVQPLTESIRSTPIAFGFTSIEHVARRLTLAARARAAYDSRCLERLRDRQAAIGFSRENQPYILRRQPA